MHFYEKVLKAIDDDKFDHDAYRSICEENLRFQDLTQEIDNAGERAEEVDEAFRKARDN